MTEYVLVVTGLTLRVVSVDARQDPPAAMCVAQ